MLDNWLPATIPLDYIYRNVIRRRWTSILTGFSMALVVFIFAAMLMLVAGLESTLVETGQANNIILIRQGAETEVQSSITREQAGVIQGIHGVATSPSGQPWVTKESVVLINLPKRETAKPSNVTVRGTSSEGLTLRPQVKLVAGRFFRPGTSEIIAGRHIADRFQGVGLGETLHFAQREWRVVGVFDAGRTAFNSEVWGDVDVMMQAFRRYDFSMLLFKTNYLTDQIPLLLTQLKATFKNDPRLPLEAKPETQFYGDQSRALSLFISIMGTILSVIFSLGAIIGAMITMYATVATRTAEIGTLRAIGFPRQSILIAFLIESVCMSMMGGIIGLIFAMFLQPLSISTTNFQTFSELVFGFELTYMVIIKSLLFSMLMGVIGGFFPAWKASRLAVIDALRS